MTVKKPLLIIVILLAVAAGIAIWFRYAHENSASATTLVLHGNVDIRQVQLAFNGSERIATMPAREGQHVTAHQVLATLDSQRLQYAVEHVSAQLAAQQALVDRLHAGSRPEEIQKSRAEVAAAAVDARNAQRTARRLNDLVQRHLVAREQADNAGAAADAAQARLNATQQALNLALAGPRKEDIEAAQATLQSLQAQLALQHRLLADSTLYAPSAGIIEDRILEPGDMASPQTPVYTLALTDPVWVRTYATEPDLGHLHPGMHATITTDSHPDKRYTGWIGYISPTAEFTPKSVETREVRTDLVYQVRVFACNPQDELRLGMPATVTIDLNQPTPDASQTPSPCQGH